MSGMCHKESAPTSSKQQPMTPAQDAGLPPSSSTSNGSQNAPHEPLMVGQLVEDRDIPFGHQPTLTFRVTGAASVARLEPLLLHREEGDLRQAKWLRAGDGGGDGGSSPNGGRIDFVWETTVKKLEARRHRNSRVLNRLSGAQVRRFHDPSNCFDTANRPGAQARCVFITSYSCLV